MAAFTHQHSSLFLDSSSPFLLLPNSSIKMSGLLEEGSCNNLSSWFPYSSPSEQFPQIPSSVNVGEYSNGGSHPVTEKQRTDSSSIVIDLDGSSDLQVTQKISPMDKKRKSKDGSCLSSAESKDTKPAKKQRKCNQKEEKKIKDEKMNKNEAPEVQPTGYVHVRARRGEATDSHSLAERVRREKISERLKMLQALVPGCDKVSSKALMLDEIINYVQSLQHQVEFLSMKLASTSPIFYDFGGVDLNSLMIKQEVSSCLTSPLQSVQQSLPTPSTTAFADITTTNIINNIPLLDSSISLLHQQGYIPSVSSQYNGNLLWSVDEHRQRFPNQSDFTNLYSFQ